MKVTKDLFDLSNEILETYDPGKLRAQQIKQVEQDKRDVKSSNSSGSQLNKNGVQGNKWDKIANDIDKEEKLDELKAKDY